MCLCFVKVKRRESEHGEVQTAARPAPENGSSLNRMNQSQSINQSYENVNEARINLVMYTYCRVSNNNPRSHHQLCIHSLKVN